MSSVFLPWSDVPVPPREKGRTPRSRCRGVRRFGRRRKTRAIPLPVRSAGRESARATYMPFHEKYNYFVTSIGIVGTHGRRQRSRAVPAPDRHAGGRYEWSPNRHAGARHGGRRQRARAVPPTVMPGVGTAVAAGVPGRSPRTVSSVQCHPVDFVIIWGDFELLLCYQKEKNVVCFIVTTYYMHNCSKSKLVLYPFCPLHYR